MCPAVIIVKTIVWNSRTNLEELYLGSEEACKLLQDFSEISGSEEMIFPKLLRISFDRCMTGNVKNILSKYLVKFFGEATPNLKEFDYVSAWRLYNRRPLFKDICRKITQISIDCERPSVVNAGLNKCLQEGIENLKALELIFLCDELYSVPAEQLLLVHRNILTRVCICPDIIIGAVEAVGTVFGLPKVTSFELLWPSFSSLDPLATVLRRINPGKSLPALQDFTLTANSDGNEDYHQHYLADLESDEDPGEVTCCAKSITATSSACETIAIQCLGRFFPLISELDLECGLCGPSWDVCEIFSSFPKLEVLRLEFTLFEGDMYFGDAGVDAVLCGISKEEACVLQQQGRDGEISLPDLTLVPMRPRLADLKCLKKLSIEIKDQDYKHNMEQISEVSGLLVFSKLPGLKVDVKGSLSVWEGSFEWHLQ